MKDEIKSLKNEAINGGDNTMVAICNVALFGDVGDVALSAEEAARVSAMSKDEAIAECERVIAEGDKHA